MPMCVAKHLALVSTIQLLYLKVEQGVILFSSLSILIYPFVSFTLLCKGFLSSPFLYFLRNKRF